MRQFKISDAYDLQKNMMTKTGVWHEENPSVFYKIRRLSTWTIFVIAFAGMLIQFVYVITDFEQLVQILYLMTSYTSYFFKMSGFIYNRRTFLNMLQLLENPIFVPEIESLKEPILKAIKLSALITQIYRFTCVVVVILFCIYPFLENMPLPTPFPFDLGRFNPIMYVIQSLGVLIAAWNNLSLDTLSASLMGLASSQFDVLKYKIIHIKEYGTEKLSPIHSNIEHTKESNSQIDEIVAERLTDCIQHHWAIIMFVENIEETFSFGLLAQFLGSIIVICNTGFYLLMVSTASLQFISLAIYFMTMMTQLSLYCWFGNEIILKSLEVSEACYLSNWYTSGRNIQQILFIIMERSKRPLSVTAWKFSQVSLHAFSSIIQWSYSYFALLQRLSRNKELS